PPNPNRPRIESWVRLGPRLQSIAPRPSPCTIGRRNLGRGAMLQLQSVLGVIALLAIACAISEHRRLVAWRPVITGLALTIVLAFVLIKVPQVTQALAGVNRAVGAVADATRAGTSFVFGYLGGGPLPYELKVPGA